MANDSTSDNHPAPQIEASISQLSINSSASEDWDRSVSDIAPPSTPSQSASRIPQLNGENGIDNDGTPSGTKGRKSLSDLLRLHAEKGKDLHLSEEDELRLSEELGRWINSDSSPYEPDDDFFSRPSRDDSALSSAIPARLAEISGRPRGQSESVLSMAGVRPSTAVCGSTDSKN
ncbi:hypothetical protein Clacol_004738 [Clathrus columnatus]|uniref:Uncharacterized protein n=1 Tax=Clathrus columnatus TaxID=1419009 RepID=A0AAV5AAB1_9AGAM|nr:hypothetical protein Clacol_004738 [Clathrus columnatus]